MTRNLTEYTQAAIGPVLLLGIWETMCRLFNVPAWLLPSPSKILIEGYEILPILPAHLMATLLAVLGGFVLSIAGHRSTLLAIQ